MNAITKPVVWTAERKAALRKLHGKFTTAEIGRKLGVSKSAVCGMIYRLGLTNENNNPAKKAAWSQADEERFTALWNAGASHQDIMKHCDLGSKSAVQRRVKSLGLSPRNVLKNPRPRSDEPAPTGKTGGCQWLQGEPRDRNFCGAPLKPKSPSWCEHHHERVYLPPKPKKAAKHG